MPHRLCISGSCVASPESVTYDFEDGLPLGWEFTGDADWGLTTDDPHGGVQAVQSGEIGEDQSSGLKGTFNFPVESNLSFWLKTSTEGGYDKLFLVVDGETSGVWDGETGWLQHSVFLSAGLHTVEWRYVKDDYESLGLDRVWIDDVTVTAGALETLSTEKSLTTSTAWPPGFSSSGGASWFIGNSNGLSDSHGVQSGAISDSETSRLTYQVTYPSDVYVGFYFKTSTEPGWDLFTFYVNGDQKGQWSGELGWTFFLDPCRSRDPQSQMGL